MYEDLNIYFIGNKSYKGIKSSTINECFEYLKDKQVISLDIETTQKYGGRFDNEGLDPYLSKIVMVQIGDKHRQYVIDYRHISINPLLKLLTDPTKIIVGQNIKFEYKHFYHNEKIRINNVYDTMIAEQILFNGLNVKANLATLNKKYLNIEVDKGTRLEFLRIKNKPFTIKQIKYGAEDILYPLLIREKQLKDLEKKDMMKCLHLEMLFLEVIGDVEYKGITFNKNKWIETYEDNLVVFKEYTKKLDDYVLSRYEKSNFIDKQLDLFSTDLKCNIQWTSSKQVIEFFKFLNICPKAISKTTKKLSYTLNAKVLKTSLNTINKDAEEHKKELIKTYLRFKELEQVCTTFGKSFFKYINPITKRLHSNYRQILNTGRISSSNPNLQNIPSGKEFRIAFDAPKGYKIINADYSGQEQVILANKSQDKDLIYFYKQGLGDMHSFVASKIFPELSELSLKEIKQNHSDKRQIAKAAGFAINYGGNGHTISENLGIPIEQGEYVYNAYFKAFPGLKSYFTKVQKAAIKRGFILIDEITKRKNWFYPPQSPKDKGKVERAALNFPIQGEAGSITKLAGILFRKYILDNKLQDSVFITNFVHDKLLLC